MKLFMFYVGGDCGNSNTELHDVRFAVGNAAEDCHEDLRRQWWGTPASLHLDCWGAVEQADGFDIELVPAPVDNDGRFLFFANMGGYRSDLFAELHHNELLVASSAAKAKTRALAKIADFALPHKDSLFELERLLDVGARLAEAGLHLKLSPTDVVKPFSFVCD